MNVRLKCVEKLHEMSSALEDIKMQWDNRRYSTPLVLKKIEKLQENISDFNHFYLIYIARTEDGMKDHEALAAVLERCLTPEQD